MITNGLFIRVIRLALCAIRDIRDPRFFFFGCRYAVLSDIPGTS
jgi:hypothetical protein